MTSTEDMRFSINANMPKENLHALDNVLNELFGSLSSKMKKAGEFIEQTMEQAKMRPPHLSPEESTVEDEETDEDMPDLVSDCDSEYVEQDFDSEYVEQDFDSEYTDEEEEDIDHIFVLLIDRETVGYSPTLRGARSSLQEYRDQILVDFEGLFRVEQNPNSFRIYRKTPYLWFMYSDHLVVEAEIQVITKL